MSCSVGELEAAHMLVLLKSTAEEQFSAHLLRARRACTGLASRVEITAATRRISAHRRQESFAKMPVLIGIAVKDTRQSI